MEEPVLQLDNVTKTFGSFVAVDSLSFEVRPGVLYGLLGPNGAGKTSTIRMITGIHLPDEGRIRVQSQEVTGRLNYELGYLPEERGLYKKMPVGDHLMYLIRLRGYSKKDGKKRVQEWMDRFDIADWWDKKVEELSKGMQQKVQFIAAVMHDPKVMILDEPFSGLDPVNANLIRDEILRLREKGCGIILSTHRMEQVEELCEEITLINHGKNMLTGNIDEIKSKYWNQEYLVGLNKDIQDLQLKGAEILGRDKKGRWKLRLLEGHSADDLLRQFLSLDFELIHFEKYLPSLNEIFIEVTGEPKESAA